MQGGNRKIIYHEIDVQLVGRRTSESARSDETGVEDEGFVK